MTIQDARKASILIVDDTVENLQLMATMLNGQGYESRPVPNGPLALQAAELDPPDLILLDVAMPAMNGYEVCERLKSNPLTRDIPVIFVSARDETMDKVRAFRVGGSDYVTKPFQYEEVFARIDCHLSLRHARLELERSYRQLHDLEDMRDSLVHMIVHDMRSPLQVLIAQGYFLKQELRQRHAGDFEQDVDALLEAADRLQGMANNVLDVSRLEAGRMPLELGDHDLCVLVQDVVQRMRPLYVGRAVSVEAPEPTRVRCDGKLLCRVIENLVSNGLKHTPPERGLRISVLRDAAGARVSVDDEGAGIAPEQRERIFEKYGAIKRDGTRSAHSAGLGLAMCRLAIAAHGGAIGVESAPIKGSRFWFTVPHAASAA